MEAVGLGVHTGTTAIGQTLLTAQLAASLRTNFPALANISTRATVGHVGLGIDTQTSTLGQTLLTAQLTGSVGADFPSVAEG